MTALALREDQDYWDEKQLAVLRQTGIGEQVSSAELAAFLHLCQRTGLDPFARQIYLIGRWDTKAGREVFRPQTGIDGYRIVAQRTVERTRQSFGYEDSLWCGEDGKWTDVWLSADPPAAAKVTVLRDGKRFPAIARWSEYVPLGKNGNPTGLWVKRHAAQLEKCAESLALRKAFPNDMAGVYTSEEMEQADNPPHVTVTAEVVKEEPAQDGDDPFYVRPAPEVSTDQEWLTATLKIIPEIRLEACRKLWPEVIGKVRAGTVAKPDGTRVMDLLKARMEALASPQEAAPSEPEAASPVADALDPADPWALKVEELSNEDEATAALDEVAAMVGSGAMQAEHADRIEKAIAARFPQAAGRAVAALWTVLPG